ncbi:LysM peptidoglycan-binding domain-containing protein [Thermithiobacillus plumbiphilus]|uniref:LysM peptidoglycan-binding domain-containing protein n=1 Tax=Thermithiobacillus plumbiphilus TaxID=1729899 RepID=A0ABU9DAK1_9PROT
MRRHLKPLAIAGLGLALLAPLAYAAAPYPGDQLSLPKGYKHLPESYVVRSGDTLWDLSSRFLKNPWRWMQIWERNSYITNPDLIYPGDLLVFDQSRGMLKLRVVRATPQARSLPLEAIPTVNPSLILPYLNRPGIITDEALAKQPYLVGDQNQRVLFGQHDTLYAKGFGKAGAGRFDIVRAGPELVDPATGKPLGRRMDHVGVADVSGEGPLRRADIIQSYREILTGDRLLAQPETPNLHFQLQTPSSMVNGAILAGEDSISEMGQGSVALINLGSQAGMQPGQVLTVSRAGRTLPDPVKGGEVTLPEIPVGTAMVFRTFDKVSYVLFLESSQAIRVGSRVHTPGDPALRDGAPQAEALAHAK